MIPRKEGVLAVGAASVAEVGAHLALDSTLASLAAFGSVLGLGVLHFRTRKAKLRASPSPQPSPSSLFAFRAPTAPEVNPMPPQPPTPMPRRDETFIAVAELCTRIDELQRTLNADDGIPQRLDAIRQELGALANGWDLRADRSDELRSQQASALAEACRAIEARVGASESRIAENTRRIERALQESDERGADRAEASLVRLTRELATLRDDVQRAAEGIAAFHAEGRAPVALADEHARLLESAAESAGALGRRVATMAERLDAGFAHLGVAGNASAAKLEDTLRATREHMAALSRDAAALHASSTGLRNAIAESEQRLARAVHESGARIESSVRELRGLVESLPAPEKAPDLAPIVSAVLAAEEKLTARVRSLESTLRPEPVDFAPVMHAVRDARDELATRIAAIDIPRADLAPIVAAVKDAKQELGEAIAGIQVPDVDVGPAIDAVEASEDRLHRKLAAIESLVREKDLDLAPVVEAVDEAVRSITIPQPARVDLAPIERAIAHVAKSVREIPAPEAVDLAPVQRALADVHAEIAGVSRSIAALPTPERVDLAPVHRRLDELGHMVASVPEPARVELAPIERRLDELARSISALPEPERVDLAPLHKQLDELSRAVASLPEPERLDLAPLAEKLDAVSDKIEPVARPLRATEERLTLRLDRLAEAVLQVPGSIPVAKPTDLRPLQERLDDLHAAILAIPTPEVPAYPEIPPFPEIPAFPMAELRDMMRKLRDELAAGAPEVDLAPVLSGLREAEERIARRMAALSESERVARREETLKLESGLATLRQAIEIIPAPPAFPLDAIHSTLADVEERLARRMASASDSERVARREETLRLDAAIASVRQAIEALPTPPEPPAFPLDEIAASVRASEERLDRRLQGAIAGVRDAVANLPRPEPPAPFPLEAIRAAIRDVEAHVDGAIAAIPRPEPPAPFPIESIRAAIREIEAHVDRAVAAIPRPSPAPEFPLGEIQASVRGAEERLLSGVESLREAVRAIPAPERAPEFPMDELRAGLRASEERLARAVRDIDASRAVAELATRIDRAATHGEVESIRALLVEGTDVDALRHAELQRSLAALAQADRETDARGPIAELRAASDRHAAALAERLDHAATWMREESERADVRMSSLEGSLRPLLPAIERATAATDAVPERILPAFAPLATSEGISRVRDDLLACVREERSAIVERLAHLHESTAELVRKERAHLSEEVASSAGPLLSGIEAASERTLASIDRHAESVFARLDAAAARSGEDALSILDAVEDLRADADARQRHLATLVGSQETATRAIAATLTEANDTLRARIERLESGSIQREQAAKARLAAFQTAVLDALEAHATRVEERLAAAEARIEDAMGGTMREDEIERRIAARMAAMEARLLEAVTRHAPRDPAPVSIHPRPHRRTRPPTE